jgi:hypothetical protein
MDWYPMLTSSSQEAKQLTPKIGLNPEKQATQRLAK